MTNITAKVTPQGNKLQSRVNPQEKLQVTEYRLNVSNLRLSDLFDVDTSGAEDGAVLVYNGNTVSFEATTEIKNPNTQVNGGNY